jgi:hypothetical protein
VEAAVSCAAPTMVQDGVTRAKHVLAAWSPQLLPLTGRSIASDRPRGAVSP